MVWIDCYGEIEVQIQTGCRGEWDRTWIQFLRMHFLVGTTDRWNGLNDSKQINVRTSRIRNKKLLQIGGNHDCPEAADVVDLTLLWKYLLSFRTEGPVIQPVGVDCYSDYLIILRLHQTVVSCALARARRRRDSAEHVSGDFYCRLAKTPKAPANQGQLCVSVGGGGREGKRGERRRRIVTRRATVVG
ncbi:unnamed protein product, partial [Timema podura]|nr:unnamed protein product [Timema podura]